jgi:cytochrome c553
VPAVIAEEQQQQQQQHSRQQLQTLTRLLACAPNTAAFSFYKGLQHKPHYWDNLRSWGQDYYAEAQESLCRLWCKLLMASPEHVVEVAVAALLSDLTGSSSSSGDVDATTAAVAVAEGSRQDSSKPRGSEWCWACHSSGAYKTASSSISNAAQQTAADLLMQLHGMFPADSNLFTQVLAQQQHLQLLLQQLACSADAASGNTSAAVAVQLLPRVWQRDRQQYQQQHVQQLAAALVQLVDAALAGDSNTLQVVSSIAIQRQEQIGCWNAMSR